MTAARTFTSHNHASKAAAIAECMRAGMTPWWHATLVLFAMPGNREPYAIGRYDSGAGPRWAIVRYNPGQAELPIESATVPAHDGAGLNSEG